MTSNARILLPAARSLLTDDFRLGISNPDLTDYLSPLALDRNLDLVTVKALLERTIEKFREDPAHSDEWLAPRFHAALRLRRTEAGDTGLWRWLGVVVFDDYVRWRFSAVPLKRFVGGDRDHALSRLWWGAELFRNGGDYGPVTRAFSMQDIPNTWLILNAMHNRAAAQAALTYLPDMSSDTINKLSTALDDVLMTIQLDAVAPADQPDVVAADEWVAETADIEDLFEEDLPEGPIEDSVSEEAINAVKALIERVAEAIGLDLPQPAEAKS
jgi:hypothetical protein